MHSVEELFDFLMQQESVVVYGNLGRQPGLIADHLVRFYPTLEVTVLSKYYHFPERENVHVNTPLSKCDLLIYVEPPPNAQIVKPSFVSRVIAFTSHLVLARDAVVVSFYCSSDPALEMRRSATLTELQDGPTHHRRSDVIKKQIDFFETKTLSQKEDADYVVAPDKPYPDFARKTYVLVDLTHCRSPPESFLHLLDAYDVLKHNADKVERWKVCFPEHSLEKFESFVQNFVDRLFCQELAMGNLTNKSSLLKMTPFYRTFCRNAEDADGRIAKIPSHHFFGYRVFNPDRKEDAYLLNVVHNLEPVGDWLYIK